MDIICSNPKTAGVARWNFLALWGHKSNKGEKAALEYVTNVFDHVPVQPRDAREASDVFYRQKKGDVLVTQVPPVSPQDFSSLLDSKTQLCMYIIHVHIHI